jgi:hypothetical protein
MGMYNTFLFKNALYCPICGEEQDEIQSHDYGQSCKFYKCNDLVDNVSKEYNGNEICAENIYCFGKNHDKKINDLLEFSSPIYFYIVIKNYRYIGVMPSRDLAETLLGLDEDEYYFNQA